MITGASTLKLEDLSGGLNVFDAANALNDNQCVKAVNMTVEGKSLVTSPGFVERFKAGTTNDKTQGVYVTADGDVFSVQNNQIYLNGLAWIGYQLNIYAVSNTTLYQVTIDGVNYDYTSDGTATRDEIMNGIKAAIDAASLPYVTVAVESLAIYTRTDGDAATNILSLLISDSATHTVAVNANVNLQGGNATFSFSNTQRVNFDFDGNYLVACSEDGSAVKAFYRGSNLGIAGLTTTEARAIGFHEAFMFVAAKNGLYNSRPATPAYPWRKLDFSGTGSGSRLIGNSSAIVAFTQNNEKFYIGKSYDSVWTISDITVDATTAAVSVQVKQLTSTGPVNQQCFVNVQQDVMYFDGRSVRRLSYEANTLALKDSAVSVLIDPLIKDLPENQQSACSSFKYPYYNVWMASNEAGTGENDVCFKYMVEKTSWTSETGKTVSCAYATSRASVAGSTFDGTVWDMDKGEAWDDDGREFDVRSKYFDFGDNVGNKRLYQIQIDGLISPNDTAYLDVYSNASDTPKYTWAFDANGYQKLPTTLGTLDIGSGTIGSGGSYDKKSFSHRFSMFADGPVMSFAFRGNGYTYLRIDSVHCIFKNLRTNNFRIHG